MVVHVRHFHGEFHRPVRLDKIPRRIQPTLVRLEQLALEEFLPRVVPCIQRHFELTLVDVQATKERCILGIVRKFKRRRCHNLSPFWVTGHRRSAGPIGRLLTFRWNAHACPSGAPMLGRYLAFRGEKQRQRRQAASMGRARVLSGESCRSKPECFMRREGIRLMHRPANFF